MYYIDKDGELYHWKYTRKERVNGKWRYWYGDKYDNNHTQTTVTTTTYKNTNSLIGNTTKFATYSNGQKNETVYKSRGKIEQAIDKGKDYVDKILYGTAKYDKYDNNHTETKTTTTTYKNVNKPIGGTTKTTFSTLGSTKSTVLITKNRGQIAQMIDKGRDWISAKLNKKKK